MSLLKYVTDGASATSDRGKVSFGRAHLDGVPYRGPSAMLREEEYEDLTEVVQDGHVAVFDLSKEEDKQMLTKIVDAAANSWYSIWKMQEHAALQSDGSVKIFVYCVWTQPYRELAKHRVPASMITKQ